MKRMLAIITIFLLSAGAFAQETKKPVEPAQNDRNENLRFKNRVFEVQNRNPEEIASAIRLLGSGLPGSGLSVNNSLRTITVRDFPENIATIEEAIRRLDRPAPPAPDIDLRISILIGSNAPLSNAAPLPDDLLPVVKELKSALRYPHYILVTSNVAHPQPGPHSQISNNGVAEPSLLGVMAKDPWGVTYNYELKDISLTKVGERPALSGDFSFRMRFPFALGSDTVAHDARFNTPVTVRDGEKLVVGTTTVGDKAAIVVMAAKFGEAK